MQILNPPVSESFSAKIKFFQNSPALLLVMAIEGSNDLCTKSMSSFVKSHSALANSNKGGRATKIRKAKLFVVIRYRWETRRLCGHCEVDFKFSPFFLFDCEIFLKLGLVSNYYCLFETISSP